MSALEACGRCVLGTSRSCICESFDALFESRKMLTVAQNGPEIGLFETCIYFLRFFSCIFMITPMVPVAMDEHNADEKPINRYICLKVGDCRVQIKMGKSWASIEVVSNESLRRFTFRV